MSAPASSSSPNALALEKSPYLLQHAHNPVAWLPWGEAAFRQARDEDKLIFLSVGYSTCHWCHVMEHESFENADTAALMNEHFVNIKVDREERPDVDATYMAFVQASTGQGGWPMSVWLTPDLKPVVGGTYFPPEDRGGRPGFPSVLRQLGELWKKDRAEMAAQGERVLKLMREEFSGKLERGGDEAPGEEVFAKALEQFDRSYDRNHGGFSMSPKFPRPAGINLLLRLARRAGDGAEAAQGMASHTLREMACGGMYDQLGGGFHRYSVDRHWHVPHFEKMLYDQAQLVNSYLEAFQLGGAPEMREIAEETLAYIARDMTAPEGGFFSAEDADSLPAGANEGDAKHEGVFYVWHWSELKELLSDDEDESLTRVVAAAYGIDENGNVRPESDPLGEFKGANVLHRASGPGTIAEWLNLDKDLARKHLEEARALLLEARGERPRPHLDDKILTAWNGLMISRLCQAYQALAQPGYLEAAKKAASFLREELWDEETGILQRSYREGASGIPGFAVDYAALTQGLLDLYEASFELEWLQWASVLQARMDEQFFDEQHGGYLSAQEEDEHSILSLREEHDGAEPAPSSLAVSNLLRLARLTGDEALRERAGRTLSAFAPVLRERPIEMPQMAVGLDDWLGPWSEIVIVTEGTDGEGLADLLAVIHEEFRPRKTLILIDSPEAREYFGAASPAIAEMKAIDGRPTVYLCRDFACQQPVTTVEALREVLPSV